MSRNFGLVIIEIFAKNHAFQNLMYLANNTTLSKMHVIENIQLPRILQIS
jgi:hypothetical protein